MRSDQLGLKIDENLPHEVLEEIFLKLTPEEIFSTMRVNKKFYDLLGENNNAFWKIKYQKYFLDHKKIAKKKNVSWYDEFKKSYESIPPNYRSLVSLIREKRQEDLKKLFPLPEERNSSKDAGKPKTFLLSDVFKNVAGSEILAKIRAGNLQDFLDHLYILAKKENAKKPTLLEWALLCKQPDEIIDSLLAEGSHKFVQGQSLALRFAVRNNNFNIVKKLIENGAIITDTDLVFRQLFDNFNLEIMNYLLSHGANANTKVDNVPALHFAVRNKNISAVKALVAQGAIVDAADQRKTALWIAVKKGNKEIIAYLLAQYAQQKLDINKNSKILRSPLYIAAKRGHVDIVKALIAAGADVNKTNGSPLYIASSKGHLDVVKTLINAGGCRCKSVFY